MKIRPAIFIPILILLFSCHKNDSPVGVNILPASDVLGAAYTEVYPTVTYSMLDDTVYTTNITNSNLLGSMNDAILGRTDASIYSTYEIIGSLSCEALGSNPALDSVVLSLVYATGVPTLGDTNQPVSLDVFPVTESIYRDSAYYSDRNISYNKNYNLVEGGQSKVVYPRLLTQIKANKDDQSYTYPQIRVRLRKEFGEMLFNCNYLSSLSLFQNIFKGLYITTNSTILPQPTYGNIFYVDMNTSSILLYYHNDAGVQPALPIKCGANSTRFGQFVHDYKFLADPNLAHQLYPLSSADTTTNQNIYLQGAAGVKAKIEFPDLMKWADSNIVVNKAELDFVPDVSRTEYTNTTMNSFPTRLYLEGYNESTGKPGTLTENVYAFGGLWDGTNNNFAFQIPHTIAQIVKGNIKKPIFYVSVFRSAIYPERVVLGGANNTAYPIKLKLWYTRLTFPKK